MTTIFTYMRVERRELAVTLSGGWYTHTHTHTQHTDLSFHGGRSSDVADKIGLRKYE